MSITKIIEHHLVAFHTVQDECTHLKKSVESERLAVSAITNAINFASEKLVYRGLVPLQKAQGLALSMEQNAEDLNAALDEVAASLTAAIGPVEAFTKVTERIKTAQEAALRHDPDAASFAMIDSVAARHSDLCERLLVNFRELADKARRTLDELREKIDGLQASFAQISAAMMPL